MEPWSHVELNVTLWLRMNATGRYRYITAIKSTLDTKNTDFDRPSAQRVLKFYNNCYRHGIL